MNIPRYAELAARLVGKHHEGIPRVIARDRSLGAIDRALGLRRRRRALQRTLAGAAMVAAGVAMFIAARAILASPREAADLADAKADRIAVKVSPVGAGAVVLTPDGEAELTSNLEVLSGGRVSTRAHGGADFSLSTGTRLHLGAGASLSIQSAGPVQRFSFAGGVLQAHVAKLGHGERFIVDTPDAQVEVRGTAFRISVVGAERACRGHRTRLEVSEGTVEVRAEGLATRVPAGAEWPAQCAETRARGKAKSEAKLVAGSAQKAIDPALKAAPKQPATRGTPTGASEPGVRAPSTAVGEPRSSLRQQSDLFAAAIRAQKQGDTARALSIYQELVDSYPASPLAENALASRMRLLSSRDPEAARSEAERYLAHYSRGFARAEAERLTRTP